MQNPKKSLFKQGSYRAQALLKTYPLLSMFVVVLLLVVLISLLFRINISVNRNTHQSASAISAVGNDPNNSDQEKSKPTPPTAEILTTVPPITTDETVTRNKKVFVPDPTSVNTPGQTTFLTQMTKEPEASSPSSASPVVDVSVPVPPPVYSMSPGFGGGIPSSPLVPPTPTICEDNTANNFSGLLPCVYPPTNQDAVFSSSITKQGGASVSIVSSGDTSNNIWFAPASTTSFVSSTTMTKTSNGLSTSILAPMNEGAYKLYVINSLGGVSTSSGAVLTVDNTSPTTVVTYSDPDNLVKSGDSLTVTATFSEEMADSPVPKISISGSNTVTSVDMTKSSTTVYTYMYTVSAGDGVSTVAISAGTDVAGNVVASTPTSGASFTVDSTAPTVSVSYSDPDKIVKIGDVLTITATFSESVLDTPIPKISISGSNVLTATDMTKSSSTVYTYLHSVSTGDGTATVAFSSGVDAVGNTIVPTPTFGATFTVDNTAPATTTLSVFECAHSLASGSCTTNSGTLHLSWTNSGADVSSYGIWKDGVLQGTTTSLSVNLSATVGTFSFAVTASDVAGNTATSTTQSVTVITLPSIGYYCSPYSSSYAENGSYKHVGVVCNYLSSSFSGNRFGEVYRGTITSSTLVNSHFLGMSSNSMQFHDEVSSPVNGEHLFSVIYEKHADSDTINFPSYFKTGANPPPHLNYGVINWIYDNTAP